MKANEAPEKIYLEWQTVGDERYRIWGTRPITNDEPVEYTRTDAFIEKALKWMTTKECIDDVLSVEMIAEFKTYMEKE